MAACSSNPAKTRLETEDYAAGEAARSRAKGANVSGHRRRMATNGIPDARLAFIQRETQSASQTGAVGKSPREFGNPRARGAIEVGAQPVIRR